ncbi:IS5 family transposase [Xanthomonas sp. MUS 060]|uniref:IS5 family transposase n=1 Tax=Xanthomonas sp. MUS 060 TaxID=1588031 RepID=UPI0005F27BEE|nr:IS5 family transposase [Xanthomonas sp. MUS 060]
MQLSFGDAEYNGKRKRTRREMFLAQMDQVVPWKGLLALIEPHSPKSGQPVRQPYPMETMLRIHFFLKDGERDPDMRQTKKGNQYFFGMKAHIGVDDESGLVHHVECTAANAADITQAHKLLHGKQDTVCGDSGYTGLDKREEMKGKRKLRYLIAEKPSKLKQITSKRELKLAKRWEHTKASLRAKVEHPFRVIKRQFGYVKVRYRGLAKNTAQVLTLFALSNLWLKRKQLMPVAGKVCLSPRQYA